MALPLMAAGTGLSAVGSLYSGQAEANASKFNAAVADRNAGLARQRGVFEQGQLKRSASQILGAMRANIGASGVRLEGSPLDVLDNSTAQAQMDQVMVKYNSELQAMGFEQEAAANRTRAKTAKTMGRIGAASSLLMGGARMSQFT